MPIAYKIDKEQRMVLATATGLLCFSEIGTYLQQLRSDSEFDPSFNHLIDTSGLTRIELSEFEFRIVSQYRGIFSATTRHALVYPPSRRWMANLVQIYHQASFPPSKLEVFQDVASALVWLGEGQLSS